MIDEATGGPAVPEGSVGHRYGQPGRWNLRPNGRRPRLSVLGPESEAVVVHLPRFDIGGGEGGSVVRRGVPTVRIGGQVVTTVLDLVLAQYGVARPRMRGDWPQRWG